MERSKPETERTGILAGLILAAMPILSFGLQYMLSAFQGTSDKLLQHYTVSIIDWLFVPFNFLVVRHIDWRRGGSLLALMALSTVFNTAAHAIWQYGAHDGGHMVTSSHVFLPAGWVHLGYSTIQMVLLLGFIFCRRVDSNRSALPTAVAAAYFISAAASGYFMHRQFLFTDVVMTAGGIALLLIYPKWNAGRVSRGSLSVGSLT
jgi:hypothetical protein